MKTKMNIEWLRRSVLGASLLALVGLGLGLGLAVMPASAACTPIASDKGQVFSNLSVSAAGKYSLWLRMLAPTATSHSVYVQLDDRCPVTASDSQAGSTLTWVKAATYDLVSGNHNILLAGQDAGTGVDRVLVTDAACTPQGVAGDNCITGAAAGSTTPAANGQNTTSRVATPEIKPPNWWLVGASSVAGLSALAFAAWKYRLFMRGIYFGAQNPDVVVGGILHPEAKLITKLLHFAKHHRVTVAVCGGVVVGTVILGVVSAQGVQPFFEAEAGKLSGGAAITVNSDASGGKYAVFNNNPAGSQSGGTKTGGSTSGGSSSGGGSSGGGSSGGGATTSCALPKYPDASCTGVPAGTQLTAYTGPTTISTANTIIDAKIITDCITINAPGVTIKRSRVNANGCAPDVIMVNAASIYHGGYSGAAALIEDSEISCMTSLNGGTATSNTGIGDNNVTVLRNNIYGCENGFDMDLNADIEDNYIHDLYQSDIAHTDGLQSYDGSNMKLIHNTFYGDTPLCPNPDYCAGTSAVNVNNNTTNGIHTANMTIKDNLLAGGAYTLYCPMLSTSNVLIQNNHFSYKFRDPNSPRTYGPGVAAPWKPDAGPGVGDYGPWSDCQDGATLSGNVFHETELAIP
jgi:hypothetical protein